MIPPPEPGEGRRRDTRLRFEQWARNPTCQANTISAVHGTPMGQAVTREGGTPTMGQSPFALARGETFERGLFKGDATALRNALADAEVVDASAVGFWDFRLRQHGGEMRTQDEARGATTTFLRQFATGQRIEGIAAAPTILIPSGVMLPEAILVVDVLVVRVRDEMVELVVGEVKTYPDRGGHTDGGELATARAQAGVYVHGLQMVVAELGLSAHVRVATDGFLVLSRPGSNRPSIRAGEDLRYQARRAARGFAQLEAAAAALGSGDESDVEAAILAAETNYCEACLAFCDRAPTCFQRAVAADDPVVLGADVKRFLGPVNLARAAALLGGAAPETEGERSLVAAMQEAET